MVFDVKPIPIHAGSMRYYVCKKGSRYAAAVSPAVTALREAELASGFDRPETFAQFAGAVAERRSQLMDLLTRIKANGQRIVGYGASGRANTMIQYCGIDQRHVDYMVDDAPAKAGMYTPGSHLLVQPSGVLRDSPPDFLLVFAWSFFDEIARKCEKFLEQGGQMIVPLPEVRVIAQSAVSGATLT
jgi:hypothetical protein